MRHWKLLLLLLFCAARPVAAVDTAFWQIGTFDEFLQGTLHDVSVSKDGDLSLAPEEGAPGR